MGGPHLEFINIQPPKGGPPLEFINIQPLKRGSASSFWHSFSIAVHFVIANMIKITYLIIYSWGSNLESELKNFRDIHPYNGY